MIFRARFVLFIFLFSYTLGFSQEIESLKMIRGNSDYLFNYPKASLYYPSSDETKEEESRTPASLIGPSHEDAAPEEVNKAFYYIFESIN